MRYQIPKAKKPFYLDFIHLVYEKRDEIFVYIIVKKLPIYYEAITYNVWMDV
jgi:hypothetical protein